MMKSIIERNDVAAFSMVVKYEKPIDMADLFLILQLDRHEMLKIILDLKHFEAGHVFNRDDGWTILHSAVTCSATNCVGILIEYGANVKALALGIEYTPIDIAVIKPSGCLALLLKGCDKEFINRKHPKRGTLMRVAVLNSYTDSVELLIEHGAKREEPFTPWVEEIYNRRQNTRRASQVIILMLKHQRIVCKDLAIMIGKAVWETRWLNPTEELSPKRKK